MSAKTNSTAKEFTVHPALIYSLITKQASGAPKALLELVMNSVDAGATLIDIQLSESGYVIADNGSGFKDKDTISSFFGTFGTPHQDGDAFYGRFRLGRAQSFGISKSKWYSKDFCMAVDLKVELDADDKNAPLGYEVTEGHEYYNGCKIVGEFYKKQNVGAVSDFYKASIGERPEEMPIIPALIKMIRYIPCEVRINGEKVNLSPSDAAVHTATDYALFVVEEAKAVSIVNIYNKGVYAYQLETQKFCGDVISVDAIDLNIARNEAKNSCVVAKKIKNKLKALDASLNEKSKSKSAEKIDISSFINNIWQAIFGMRELNYEVLSQDLKKRVIPLANDRKVSFWDIALNLSKNSYTIQNGSYEAVFYDLDSLKVSTSSLDLMGIENNFLPLSLFPSSEILNCLDGELRTFPEHCNSYYYPAIETSVWDEAWKKSHVFDFSAAKTQIEKMKLSLMMMVSACYALDIGYEYEGLYRFMPYGSARYVNSKIRIAAKREFSLVEYASLTEVKVLNLFGNLVNHNVKLTEFEKMVISTLTSNEVLMGGNYNYSKIRALEVVNAEPSTLAYTDGKLYIHINHDYLRRCIENGDFEDLMSTYFHEYCHDESSMGVAAHGATFYAQYMSALRSGFMGAMIGFYNGLAQRIEKRVSAKGTAWIKESGVSLKTIKKIAVNRMNNKVRAFG